MLCIKFCYKLVFINGGVGPFRQREITGLVWAKNNNVYFLLNKSCFYSFLIC